MLRPYHMVLTSVLAFCVCAGACLPFERSECVVFDGRPSTATRWFDFRSWRLLRFIMTRQQWRQPRPIVDINMCVPLNRLYLCVTSNGYEVVYCVTRQPFTVVKTWKNILPKRTREEVLLRITPAKRFLYTEVCRSTIHYSYIQQLLCYTMKITRVFLIFHHTHTRNIINTLISWFNLIFLLLYCKSVYTVSTRCSAPM